MLGIFCTAILSAALAVYILHDVDVDEIGQWNRAFAGLCTESILFTVMVGGVVALLTLLGRHLSHLKECPPRAKLSLCLGISVIVFQYLWDFAARAAFPRLANVSLGLYLIVAIVLCSIVILRDTFTQMRLRQAPPASFES